MLKQVQRRQTFVGSLSTHFKLTFVMSRSTVRPWNRNCGARVATVSHDLCQVIGAQVEPETQCGWVFDSVVRKRLKEIWNPIWSSLDVTEPVLQLVHFAVSCKSSNAWTWGCLHPLLCGLQVEVLEASACWLPPCSANDFWEWQRYGIPPIDYGCPWDAWLCNERPTGFARAVKF